MDSFEKIARRVRLGSRRLPLLKPLLDRTGMWLWLRHLDKIAETRGLRPLDHVRLSPAMVRQALPIVELPIPLSQESAAERGGDWDRSAVPLSAGFPWSRDEDQEPLIAFDRKGRPCLVAGSDEWAAAEDSPVEARVVLRHARWSRIARRVMAYAEQRSGSAYQPYLHPDLTGIPADHGEERFAPILEAVPNAPGTLLDLGANAGYFSHRFEAAGFDCIAVERSEKEAYFLSVLRNAAERRFTILKGSLTELKLPPVDVTLALSIFHHFLKSEAGHRELEEFLRRLRTRHMAFEPHLPEETQMQGAAHNPTPEEFADWVGRLTGLSHRRFLGHSGTGRPLFLLSASDSET